MKHGEKGALDVRPLKESGNLPQNLGVAHLGVIESRSIDQRYLAPVEGERFGALYRRCARKKVGPHFKVLRSTREIRKLSGGKS